MSSLQRKLTTRLLTRGAGKANHALHTLTKKGAPTRRTLFVTTREEVEGLDLRRFISNFGPHLSPEETLGMQGKVLFAIDGYDAHTSELYEIPSVRRFYAEAHRRWPCWNFYGDLRSECLSVVAACIIPKIIVARRARSPKHRVHILQSDIIEFCDHSLLASSFLFEKSGVARHRGMNLFNRAARYLVAGPV